MISLLMLAFWPLPSRLLQTSFTQCASPNASTVGTTIVFTPRPASSRPQARYLWTSVAFKSSFRIPQDRWLEFCLLSRETGSSLTNSWPIGLHVPIPAQACISGLHPRREERPNFATGRSDRCSASSAAASPSSDAPSRAKLRTRGNLGSGGANDIQIQRQGLQAGTSSRGYPPSCSGLCHDAPSPDKTAASRVNQFLSQTHSWPWLAVW